MVKTEFINIMEELDQINDDSKVAVNFYIYSPSDPDNKRLLHSYTFDTEAQAKEYLTKISDKTKKFVDLSPKLKACSKYEEDADSFTVEGAVRFYGPFWYTPTVPSRQEITKGKGTIQRVGYKIVVEKAVQLNKNDKSIVEANNIVRRFANSRWYSGYARGLNNIDNRVDDKELELRAKAEEER